MVISSCTGDWLTCSFALLLLLASLPLLFHLLYRLLLSLLLLLLMTFIFHGVDFFLISISTATFAGLEHCVLTGLVQCSKLCRHKKHLTGDPFLFEEV